MRFAPGYRLPLGHSHREQEEAYFVVSGSGWARLDDEVAALRRWDVLRVAAAVVRSFEGGPDWLNHVTITNDVEQGRSGRDTRLVVQFLKSGIADGDVLTGIDDQQTIGERGQDSTDFGGVFRDLAVEFALAD
jgi:ssDNA-binding replication factor A large subunit